MKVSHINQKRTEAILNRVLVQGEFDLTDEQYSMFIYELGYTFLQKVYPNRQDSVETFSQDQRFWKWWKASFSQWENELIEYLQFNLINAGPELYTSEMSVLAYDQVTETAWNTYLKIAF